MTNIPKTFKDKYLIIIFLLSTIFFMLQHNLNFSWDFNAFVMNGEYLFNNGKYFEIWDPPLPGILISIFSLFGRKLSEYLFIILISFLFLVSSVLLSRALNFNSRVFYLLSVSPYVLFNGLTNGSELLSLVLIELFVVFLIKKSWIAGIFLGLACLTRYNFFIFLPLVLLLKNYRKIALNIFFFVITIIPWLLYNYFNYGNLFTSIADAYAFNVKYRYYFQPFNFEHFFLVLLFMLPFFVIGIIIAFMNLRKVKLKWNTIKNYNLLDHHFLFGMLLFFSLLQYYSTPLKDMRYIFPFVLPVTYFSALGFERIKKKFLNFKKILIVFVILNIIVLVFWSVKWNYTNPDKYVNAVNVLKDRNLTQCKILSNSWPMLSYFGKIAEPAPVRDLVDAEIKKGVLLVIFFEGFEPDYINDLDFLRSKNVLYENQEFILLGGGDLCQNEAIVNYTYLSKLRQRLLITHGYEININPCFIMFEDFSLLEKSCNLLNYGYFGLDENREPA